MQALRTALISVHTCLRFLFGIANWAAVTIHVISVYITVGNQYRRIIVSLHALRLFTPEPANSTLLDLSVYQISSLPEFSFLWWETNLKLLCKEKSCPIAFLGFLWARFVHSTLQAQLLLYYFISASNLWYILCCSVRIRYLKKQQLVLTSSLQLFLLAAVSLLQYRLSCLFSPKTIIAAIDLGLLHISTLALRTSDHSCFPWLILVTWLTWRPWTFDLPCTYF